MEYTSDNGRAQPDGGQLCLGLLAHVDAGKTTLSEALLYVSGAIRRLGRVDSRDAFLDTHELERERGITIFSKQALFTVGEKRVTLLDTPGHVDFSAEMERTLQVLDYALLIVSGADGVQGHTETLWKLLRRYRVPVFLFVNKMDQAGTDREKLLLELKTRLDGRCVDFGAKRDSEDFLEAIAMSDEQTLETYLESGEVTDGEIARLIRERKVFPCFFGSALRLTGVEELLQGLMRYTICPPGTDTFGAKVFKISRDAQGSRLTWLRVTGGTLKVRDAPAKDREEKVSQIRIYNGAKYETVKEAGAGTVCAVTGLAETYPGEGLGAEHMSALPILEPVLTYRLVPPQGCDPLQLLGKLRELEEEEPELKLRLDGRTGELQAQLMGEVQIEVLRALIRERFGVAVDFGEGQIVYKETIADTVEGVGHFEPLRHYAEVHLLLEPGEPGSGLVFSSVCSEDLLNRNWQRLILTHLEEKTHVGVLTGSEITDMRITLSAGRAHVKHTEGGDFRQATYRAVRQGLMKANNILLEPVYAFRLEVPQEAAGRAMADIERMHGSFGQPETDGERAVLTGKAPVSTMRNYQREVAAYTKGRGRLSCTLKGYEPCHNTEEVLAERGYDPEADPENTPDSVFCFHGAGAVIPWYEVGRYMHLESTLPEERAGSGEPSAQPAGGRSTRRERPLPGSEEEERELQEIFARTFGSSGKKDAHRYARTHTFGADAGKPRAYQPKERLPEYLLVDGYNVIFAWDDLSALAKEHIGAARGKLMDVLCNYQGYRGCRLILVFDAYRVEGHVEETVKYHNIHVVYTREAETADQYIERTAHEIGRKYQVTVATSDGLEQIIIRGQGCMMMSARELREDVERMEQEIRAAYVGQFPQSKNYLFDYLPDELAKHFADVRLGKKEPGEEV